MLNSKLKTQNGFSLIELLVVVAIIAILAAIALPLYTQYTIRSTIAKNVSILESLVNQISNYYQTSGGNWPTTVKFGNSTITIVGGNSSVQTAVSGAGDISYIIIGVGVPNLGLSYRFAILAQINNSVMAKIQNYVVATGSGNYGQHDTIRWLWSEENGVGKSVCGTWGTAALNDTSTEVPAQYLPPGCRCTKIDQIAQQIQPMSACSP